VKVTWKMENRDGGEEERETQFGQVTLKRKRKRGTLEMNVGLRRVYDNFFDCSKTIVPWALLFPRVLGGRFFFSFDARGEKWLRLGFGVT